MKLLFNRSFLLSFMLVFELLLLSFFAYILHFYTTEGNFLAKILFFDTFILEFIFCYNIVFLLPKKEKPSQILALFLVAFFISINIFQLISYQISNDFFTQTAFNNLEFIGFLFTKTNIIVVVISILILFLLPLTLAYQLYKYLSLDSKKSLLILLLSVALIWSLNLSEVLLKKKALLKTQHNTIQNPPIYSLIQVFLPKERVSVNFTEKEIQLLNHAGFFFHPEKTYPLLKEETYHSNIEFNSTVKQPNIILLFTEGTSARTLSMYNNKFKGLTPHLQHFSDLNGTMVVQNYYNHTAATYKGLHGQLCSFFPSLGGSQWNKSIPESENIHYQCLGNILNLYGYDTTYLNVHLENKSGNDEMASHLGFKHVLSAEILKEKFLEDTTPYREHELTDHQAYSALTNYLKSDAHKNPFFITMYTAETHAWCDISKDGCTYKDGHSEVLNTLHNTDDAFGKFWEYFSHSPYAKNTIVILTTDHAHYFDQNYYALMKEYKEKYHKIFIDKVPLLIYAPMFKLPHTLNVNQANSLDLAPTLLHLLGIKKIPNTFLGDTLFERANTSSHFSISAYDSNIYIIDKNQIHHNKQTSSNGKKFFDIIEKFFAYTHQLEIEHNIFY